MQILKLWKNSTFGPQLLANVLILKKGKGVGENLSDKREILNNRFECFIFRPFVVSILDKVWFWRSIIHQDIF
jgi:hypothetical protein